MNHDAEKAMDGELNVNDPAGGARLQVLQDTVRVLANGAMTDGRYEMFEVQGPLGSGPPPHRHPWSEAYFVIEGELDVRVDGRSFKAPAGSFAIAPADSAHTYRVASIEARFIVVTTDQRASRFFKAMDREIGFPPKSLSDVLRVAGQHGIRLAGAGPSA
jgi:quercetin dioxygenase-like cupin family protein